jgi:SPP1 family phage portal protein
MLFDYLEGKTPAVNLGGITERRFFELEIARWKTSDARKAQLTGDAYYRGEHDILKRERRVVGESGKLVTVHNLPNNRIVNNQYAKTIDQKNNYLLGRRFVFMADDKGYTDKLGVIFDEGFHLTLLNVGRLSLNCGVGWLYVYIDDKGELRFKEFNSWEILPFWKDESKHEELDCVLRLYESEVYVSGALQMLERVEVYRLDGIERYTLVDGVLAPDAENFFTPYVVKDGFARNWGRVPIVPFRSHNTERPLIARVKTLQDALNETLSDFRNNMQEDQRNTLLVLKNYDGQNLDEFRRNLSVYGCVKVRTVDGQGGDVTALEVKVEPENYRVILSELKKAIIENAMSYDAKDERLQGAPNQMNIQAMYNDVSLDANGTEAEYQTSFKALLYFINVYLGGYFDAAVEIIFNRDMIMNETDVIANIRQSAGLLSTETLIAQHPWVTDVSSEVEKIAAERSAEPFAVDGFAKTSEKKGA